MASFGLKSTDATQAFNICTVVANTGQAMFLTLKTRKKTIDSGLKVYNKLIAKVIFIIFLS
ncbi:MAG: hypothetical protein AAFO07_10620 [Bacteroidota bacterium]